MNLRSRYRRKTKNRLPPKHYRRIALPPKKCRHILLLPLPPRSLPPKNEKPPTAKNYRRNALPPNEIPPYIGFTASAKVVTAKNEKTANRLKFPPCGNTAPSVSALKTVTDDHTLNVYSSAGGLKNTQKKCGTFRIQYDGRSLHCLLCLLLYRMTMY